MKSWQPSFNLHDVEIKKQKDIHKGYYRLRQMTIKHKCFDGSWSDWIVREQLKRQDAACVLLWDAKRDQVVMVEQLRVGLLNRRHQDSPWMLECVAGLLEVGESPEEAILREAKEETGCTIEHLIPVSVFFNTPGGFTEKSFVYCGVVNIKEPLKTNLDEHEDIKVHILDWKDYINTFHNIVSSASTVIATQWLSQHHDLLKQKYG